MCEAIPCSTLTMRFVQALWKMWEILTVQFPFLRQYDLMKQHGLHCNLGSYYNAYFLGSIFLLFKDLKEIITWLPCVTKKFVI